MGITIVRPEDRRLEPVDPATIRGAVPASAVRSSMRQVVSGDEPYVHIARTAAGAVIPRHSHSTPEVMVVLEGTVDVGGARCGAGTVLVIPANEEYSLEVGDESLTFLVVRPTVAAYADASS